MNCLCCDREVVAYQDEPEMPKDAVAFRSYGNYGSTVWDSLYNDYLIVHICDECLVNRAARVLRAERIIQPAPDTTYAPWDPAVAG